MCWSLIQIKPIVSVEWLHACQAQRRAVAYGPYRVYEFLNKQEEARMVPSRSTTPPRRSREGSREADHDEMNDWVHSEWAVLRHSPLVCVNQALVDQLKVLQMHRRLTHYDHSEVAYMRAASAIKAVPFSLHDWDAAQLQQIQGIGPKVALAIRQFFEQGSMAEAEAIQADRALQTMLQFTQLYGIGPRTAAQAYQAGCRTLEDLTRRGQTRLSMQLGPKESLALLPDLQTKMSRTEVQALVDEVRTAF